MFAVIKTGGKQYKVAADDVITIERLPGEAGETIVFGEVLLIQDGMAVQVGAPTVSGASVAGTLVEQGRGPKVIAFKKRRRQNSRRKRGHRQDLSIVKITDILLGGAKPMMSAKAAKPLPEMPAPVVPSQEMSGEKPAVMASTGATGGMRDSANLSLISGIGPTIEKKLRAAGIENWEQIAAWSSDDVAKWDKELALRGRANREDWVEQANELLAGKPPRAKIDQAAQEASEDKN